MTSTSAGTQTRTFKRVPIQDDRSLVFAYHHLPLIQKILGFKDSDLAIVVGLPPYKLRKAMESVDILPERINGGLNGLLMDRFGTSNICWIALHSWVNETWGEPDVYSEESGFYCGYVHPENSFEISCESGDGFQSGLNSQGIALKGIYGFDQMDEYFDLLDQMVKLPAAKWVEFWEKTHENPGAKAPVEKADKAGMTEKGSFQPKASDERHKKEMAETVAAIEKEALQGGADAMYSAGVAFARGIGMDQPDFERAALWLGQASTAGHFQASKLLALVKKKLEEKK